MAEQQMQIEMIEVKAEDIIGERRAMFDSFTTATTWSIGAVVVLLVGLYLLFG
ncbi:preprotein translocase subunit SecE [Sediminicoccus sp. KRV36]|uniref:preprotein translocase subunit SecE n=1 Tax=Sediminicoccus sp. KRV36 TaxID=3133721 RepID=UPI00200E9FC9|nr:preprotein translocase subunit SecE [Sediminicoccus rosea]UPY36009.1 preprotein translocase subunit SecE [Sediminicoccus rosea]